MILRRAHLAHSASLPDRQRNPTYFVYHTTGRGLSRTAAKAANPDSNPEAFEAAALRWYTTSGAKFYPTYLVGLSGTVYELAPPGKVTWHAAGVKDVYRGSWVTPNTQWWLKAWPGRQSPFDLVPQAPQINANSIGIDYLPHPRQAGPTPLQLVTIAELARELSASYRIPRDRLHHFGHSDLDPLERSAKNAPWDPSWDWDEYMAALGGSSLRSPVIRRLGFVLVGAGILGVLYAGLRRRFRR